jgi:hypothetical protein
MNLLSCLTFPAKIPSPILSSTVTLDDDAIGEAIGRVYGFLFPKSRVHLPAFFFEKGNWRGSCQ